MKNFLALFLVFNASLAWPSCWENKEHIGERQLFFKTFLEKPKEELFFWLVDTSKLKNWLGPFSNYKSSKEPKSPFGIGHVRRVSAPILSFKIIDEEITKYRPYKHIQYKGSPSPLMKDHIGDMCLKTVSQSKTMLEWRISFNSNFLTAKFIQFYIRFSLWRLHQSLPKNTTQN